MSNGEGSQAAQGEAEGNEGLAKEENTKVEQLREKQNIVKRKPPSSLEEDNVVKRRPPERENLLKRKVRFFAAGNNEIKRRPHERPEGGKGKLHSLCKQVQEQRRYPGEIVTKKVEGPVPVHLATQRQPTTDKPFWKAKSLPTAK
ncbi:hypothetical protein TNCT_195071 [Trichonephila clavata]|uniref:Uncharacterized protein n=1 Tax=Trichonephila clavata TaxID=2740835 RepID=A0A8X6LDL7_TRICU|nr:hypothetical protein TNCT_195071 [Trichonephila clavata]